MRSSDGRWELAFERRLGEGAYGEVLLAKVRKPGLLDRRVAVKLLNRGVGADDLPVRRLRDEARMLASLDHPAILIAHDLVELDGRMAMVCEYVDGWDLAPLIHGRDPLPFGPVLDVVEQVADALSIAWTEHQIVHRDVKPENIRIGHHGNVKLLDFGIARSDLRPRSAHTTRGTVLGTRPYLAPERFDLDDLPPRPSSDVFSLGCVLYEAWTRARFFEGLNGTELLTILDTPASYGPWLEQRLAVPTIGPIADLVRRMLAFDPKARPSALDVARSCVRIASRVPDRSTLRSWARQRRTESRPTERVAAVAPGPLSAVVDLDESTAFAIPDLARGLAAPLPGELGVETVTRLPRTDAGSRADDPAPIRTTPHDGQATTRHTVPVDDAGPLVHARGWGPVLIGGLLTGLLGLGLGLVYVASLWFALAS